VILFDNCYRGRTVLVTGDSGFKGAWLTYWLHTLGARIVGLSLPPQRQHDLFVTAGIAELMEHNDVDIREYGAVEETIGDAAPDVVFHLAAQAIVRQSYQIPRETIETNVLGTANVLEAVRRLDRRCCIVVITSDKCYANKEWVHSYRENDELGGHDIYSASKGCAEILTHAYRRSFLGAASSDHAQKPVATTRAGNVIGPGDWSADRILPDSIAALHEGREILVRNPLSIRPWQHVLEPLSGYLMLGAGLLRGSFGTYEGAWNFGPSVESAKPVSELITRIVQAWGSGSWVVQNQANQPHESTRLQLSIDKAVTVLNWLPVWDFATTVDRTVQGYKQLLKNKNGAIGARQVLSAEIESYTAAARQRDVAWCKP